MSVGDLKNNVRKLQAELKAVRYEKDVDIDSLCKGIPTSYLPIYHFITLDYSHAFATEISDKNIELSGKSDFRFMEAVYKVLREIFSYKPPITKDQFFSNGYVERKIIMCTEILRQTKARHKPPAAPKSAGPRPRQGAVLGPRNPKVALPEGLSQSAGDVGSSTLKQTAANTSAKDFTGPAPLEPGAKRPPPAPLKSANQDSVAVQVVNEIRRTVSSTMTASPSVSCPLHSTANAKPLMTADSSSRPPTGSRVGVRSPEFEEGEEVTPTEPVVERHPPKMSMTPCIVTVGDRQARAVYDPQAYGHSEADQDSPDCDRGPEFARPRPIDLIPVTPAKPPASILVKHHPPAVSSHDPHTLLTHIHRLEQSLQDLSQKFQTYSETQQQQIHRLSQRCDHLETKIQTSVTPQSMETVLARLTLLENHLTVIQAQKQTQAVAADRLTDTARLQADTSQHTPQTSTPYLPATQYMTPPQVVNSLGEHLPERAESGPPGSPMVILPSQTDTPVGLGRSQADRIANLMKSTETMLNIQVISPIKPAVT